MVKIAITYPRNLIGAATRILPPAGDLMMMRRQLLTLKALSERDTSKRAIR